MVLIGLDY